MELLQRRAAPECFCNIVTAVSRGEKATRERGRPARTNPGIASPISSTRIERQRRHGSASAGPMRFPPAGGAGCRIAGKLSGNPRDSMRARRPRSRGVLSRWCAGGYPAGDFSASRPAPLGNSRLSASPAPAVPCGSNQSVTIRNRPSRRDLGIPSRLTSTP